MTDTRTLSPLSRIELVVLGCLSGPDVPTEEAIGDAVGELALPEASKASAHDAAGTTLAALRQRGLVDEKRTLTGEGARVLRTACGLSRRRPNWRTFRQRYFPALVLGVSPSLISESTKVPTPAAVVKTLASQLGVVETGSLSELCDALIAKLLGVDGPMTLDRIRAFALAQCAKVAPGGTAADIASRIVARSGRAGEIAARAPATTPTGVDGSGPVVTPPPPPPADLLEAIREALPEIGAEGRFGSEKVFVSALWHKIEDRARAEASSLDHFKRWLVKANRNRWLTLARADAVGLMDPKQVRESEIEDLGATFHFVVDPARNPAAQQGRSHVR